MTEHSQVGQRSEPRPEQRVGYARCSTDEQDVAVQIEQLTALGVAPDRIYVDRGFSGTRRTHRDGLDQALPRSGRAACSP